MAVRWELHVCTEKWKIYGNITHIFVLSTALSAASIPREWMWEVGGCWNSCMVCNSIVYVTATKVRKSSSLPKYRSDAIKLTFYLFPPFLPSFNHNRNERAGRDGSKFDLNAYLCVNSRDNYFWLKHKTQYLHQYSHLFARSCCVSCCIIPITRGVRGPGG